jgi:hypothetical protein
MERGERRESNKKYKRVSFSEKAEVRTIEKKEKRNTDDM